MVVKVIQDEHFLWSQRVPRNVGTSQCLHDVKMCEPQNDLGVRRTGSLVTRVLRSPTGVYGYPGVSVRTMCMEEPSVRTR